MSPKQSSGRDNKVAVSTKQEIEAIQNYLSRRPNFQQLLSNTSSTEQQPPVESADTEYHLKLRGRVRQVAAENTTCKQQTG